MITVKGINRNEDRKLVREFILFVLQRFCTPATIEKCDIRVNAILSSELPADEVEEFDEAGAWMYYYGTENGRKKFEIFVNRGSINSNGDHLRRMKDFLHMLSHEMVHVKQYANGELFDYSDGLRARFKGEIFPVSQSKKMDWVYFESPWELEAYGRATGLRDIFLSDNGWED